MLGLADMFLQQEGEVDVPGYVWYGHNRIRDKRASGGVGLLVKKNIRATPLLGFEGAMWVELQVEEGNNMIIGVVHVNPEGVRVGDFNVHIRFRGRAVT